MIDFDDTSDHYNNALRALFSITFDYDEDDDALPGVPGRP